MRFHRLRPVNTQNAKEGFRHIKRTVDPAGSQLRGIQIVPGRRWDNARSISNRQPAIGPPFHATNAGA
jgi:hypothetical protein